ncbi:integrin alpha [Nitrosococcus watsonii]|uniref:FG-GAP repeat protein n=1 Tax=Nitrosococcus watsoni (strain C-113) TaxID=105559 RepID=D8K4W0_NITWC|nr:integrin alpha [Nitrosococcus watsonii]ADJ27937.1 FG-GAP repeat protein [Nitrosococcus watsonii C-113]
MHDNKATFTSCSVSSRSDSQSSTHPPRALAPRPLAVALRRVLGGGLLAAGLMGPALGQSPGPDLSPAPAPSQSKSLDLSTLDGSNGFTINGRGSSVSGAGDVNGDGFNDIVIGASSASPNGENSGQSYVVFGTNGGFPSTLELSALDGSNGFIINGIAAGDYSGISVSGAGDVNGDGFDDLVIGAPSASPNIDHSGQSYVVFGTNGGFPSTLELSALDGSNGFMINGIAAGDSSGSSVSGAGDVNGDGFDDIVIGAYGARLDSDQSGQSYLVFGASGGFPAVVELSALDDSNGFIINNIGRYDYSALSVSGAGDVDNDGFGDVLIGIRNLVGDGGVDVGGGTYVIFGGSSGFGNVVLIDPSYYPDDILVSGAGDVNGDGVDDFVIGAPGVPPYSSYSGRSYVVFGTSGGGLPTDLSTLDGSNGFTIDGIPINPSSGAVWSSVSGAGDVNGDGLDDILIGAPGASPNGTWSGQSYVVFGTDGGFPAALDLSALDGSNGFIMNGIAAGDSLGDSVSGVGDVNGDGVDDFLINAPGAGDSGQSYVVFGVASGGPAVLLKGLVAEVEALDLPAGLEHWLARPLKRAEKKLAQGEVAKALYKVVGFIQRARVLRQYGILPAAEANALIAQAKTIIKALLDLPELSGVAAADRLPADLIPSDGLVPAGPPAATR